MSRLMHDVRSVLLLAGVLVLVSGRAASAQNDVGLRSFRAARALALRGQTDEAIATFTRAAQEARASDDKAIHIASLRGLADLLSTKRPCTDSAERVLRTALAASETGDRSSADALVRLLASRGKGAEAQRVLVAAYSDVPSLGRAITKESMRYLQGQAAVELAEGHEAAALSALNQALAIAARLHRGDVSDTVAKPSGAVDDVNAWVMFDLAMLRLRARSPSIRQPKTGASILDMLLEAPAGVLDGSDDEPYPVTRLADRLLLQAHVKGSTTVPAQGC
jgi:tetratricopeptide (TPR) repeat protein